MAMCTHKCTFFSYLREICHYLQGYHASEFSCLWYSVDIISLRNHASVSVAVIDIVDCNPILGLKPLGLTYIEWNMSLLKVKVKISLLQAVEAHRAVRGQGSHIT
jgi:hypothetical protein